MSRRHRRFPGRPFVQLPIGHGVVDPGLTLFLPQPERHADGDRQSLPQRAAGHLHPRGVGRHAGHRQAAVVGAVGFQFGFRDNARLQQRGIISDSVMAMREQEAIAPLPLGIFRAIGHGMAEGGGEHIGIAQRLADIALPLHFPHLQGVTANTPRRRGDFL